MAINKTRSRTQREERLTEVAAMHRRGMTQVQIAKALGVSQPQIAYDLRIVQSRYQATQLDELDALKAEKLAQYRDIRREAWLAWERSKEDAGMVMEEFADATVFDGSRDGSERRIRRVVTKAGRLSANQYLLTILATLKAECELVGLDEERPTAPMANVNLIGQEFWCQLAQQITDDITDRIDAPIAAALASPP